MEFTKTDRRTFLRRGAMGAGALWAVSLQELAARRKRSGIALAIPSPYGPISPKIDEATGLPLIMLPDGFRYQSFSWTGDMLSDGVRCPSLHDGMAVVDEIRGRFSLFADLHRRDGGFIPQLRDFDDDDHDDDRDDNRGRGRTTMTTTTATTTAVGAGGTRVGWFSFATTNKAPERRS